METPQQVCLSCPASPLGSWVSAIKKNKRSEIALCPCPWVLHSNQLWPLTVSHKRPGWPYSTAASHCSLEGSRDNLKNLAAWKGDSDTVCILLLAFWIVLACCHLCGSSLEWSLLTSASFLGMAVLLALACCPRTNSEICLLTWIVWVVTSIVAGLSLQDWLGKAWF